MVHVTIEKIREIEPESLRKAIKKLHLYSANERHTDGGDQSMQIDELGKQVVYEMTFKQSEDRLWTFLRSGFITSTRAKDISIHDQ